eukprot:scaffold76387_cov72-Phaeocystis_antarctica.AAC.1
MCGTLRCFRPIFQHIECPAPWSLDPHSDHGRRNREAFITPQRRVMFAELHPLARVSRTK